VNYVKLSFHLLKESMHHVFLVLIDIVIPIWNDWRYLGAIPPTILEHSPGLDMLGSAEMSRLLV